MSDTALTNTAIHQPHDNPDVLIQATALNRFYGDYQAVCDFNLSLKKGEVLGLLGPNGAGKSTTLQMLTGTLSPSSGDVFIDGVHLINQPEVAKSNIGYLPEQPPVYRDMTVREYLNYCAALRGLKKLQRKTLVASASERCGLDAVANKLIGNLSKGFQQRVGIAQAILHQPKVVILDEPTVGLDPLQINQIRQLIRELGRDHAVILSTHILPEVQAVCDRVQIIHQGKTVFADSFAAWANKHQASILTVAFTGDIDADLLEKLDGLIQLKALESDDATKRFQLSFQPHDGETDSSTNIDAGAQPRYASSVYHLAQQQGWELLELTPQHETLEQVFMNLIYSEATATSDKNSTEQGL